MLLDHRYELGCVLGEGGYAKVYSAVDTETGTPCAVKRLDAKSRLCREGRKAIQAEYRLLGGLPDHPHCIKVYDGGTDHTEGKDGDYYVMERFGRALADLSWKHKDSGFVFEVMHDVFAALRHFHANGCVHLDIKPGNLLVEAKTLGGYHAKVIDPNVFPSNGIGFIGTPEYSAPELLMGEGAGSLSDLFSAGILFYELLVGRRPWYGEDTDEIYEQMMRSGGASYAPIPRTSAPEDIRHLVYDLLRITPEDRPYDAQECLVRLEPHLEHGRDWGARGSGIRAGHMLSVHFSSRALALMAAAGAIAACSEMQPTPMMPSYPARIGSRDGVTQNEDMLCRRQAQLAAQGVKDSNAAKEVGSTLAGIGIGALLGNVLEPDRSRGPGVVNRYGRWTTVCTRHPITRCYKKLVTSHYSRPNTKGKDPGWGAIGGIAGGIAGAGASQSMLEDTQQVYDVAYDNCISGIGTGTESPLAEQTVSGRERTSSTSWESQYLGGKLVAAADSGQQEQPGQVATPPFFCAGERCNDPRQSTTLTGPTGEQIADAGLCAADLASLGITKNAIKILGEGGERIVKIADYTSKAGTVIGVVDDVYSGRPLYTMALEFVPYGACFKIIGNLTPIKQAGGGATPPPPTNLIVSPNPVNGTVMQLEWQDHSYDELYFEVDDGNDIRMVPASSGTGTVEYTWTGLKPGSRTCFRVRVSNGDTHSNWEPNAAPSYQCAYSSRLGTAR